MNISVDAIIVFLILTNLMMLGSSRLGACINTFAIQGFLLGVWMLLEHQGGLSLHFLLFIIFTIAIKSLVFPWLLFKAQKEARIKREIEPFVGFTASILIGIISLAVSMWIASKLPVMDKGQSKFAISVALSTMIVGLFIIVSRKIALNQVLGYLVMENGIYILGNTLFKNLPMIVELGVLMDIFVAVFVMGIAIYRIHKEFEHINAAELSMLKG